MRKFVLFVAFLAGCSGTSEGPVFTFADLTSPSTPATVLDSDASLPTDTTTTTVAPETTTTTVLETVAAPGAVLVNNREGVQIVDDSGAADIILEEPVGAIYDDLAGGFVVQLPGAGADPQVDQRVFWSRPSSPDAQPYLNVAAGKLLRLWGVERINGSPAMILTITDPSADTEELIAFDFASGDQLLAEWQGQRALAISFSGDRFLIEARNGSNRFFEFRNAQGALMELEYNPLPGCIDDSTCPRRPRLSAMGGLVAYLEKDFDGGEARSNVVVYDLETGRESARVAIPDGATSIDFNGDHVLVNRGESQRPLIVTVATGSVGELEHNGELGFLRRGPGFNGPFSVLR